VFGSVDHTILIPRGRCASPLVVVHCSQFIEEADVTESGTYQIRVLGWIGRRWEQWFDGLSVAVEQTGDGRRVTVLTGAVVDQAALRGLLCKAWDLNLVLLSVTRLEPPFLHTERAHSGAEERHP
jgi:hypothetical protein